MEYDRELARLWRVSRTVHEMVRDRGYLVADYEISEDFESFKARQGGGQEVDRIKLNFSVDHRENEGDRIHVYFCGDKSVAKASIKKFVGDMENFKATRGILIHVEKLGGVANKTMQELQSEYHLEAFRESELLVNITNHFLVPKHTVMTKAEKQELIKRYRLKETQLPRIMLSDPVARYYGVKRGEVMKIERASETAGRYVTYRICM
ncbi:RNA polymerase Rpb5, C-terminal domain-domain-containing protein [Naematelia encephala]|uniref:DNA-directed RNA polymerases I, II, and III subunit RPABC1 n=1 Tax=Naematelia encephala TaxID=71784 RepID=A0A1Y2B4Z7_9TREE|nr:RNA polymerase Rpb5, C-terminal domain-domain-containing protein [Naematelia encephala]